MIGKKDREIKKRRLSSQSGQVLMEGLLLLVLSLGLLGATLRYLKNDKTLDKLTNAAWAGVAQMAEYGNWPGGPQPVHPNDSSRVRTLVP